MEVNLQLVGSEAGPRSLGGFWLVNLLLRGHGAFHVYTAPCTNEEFYMMIS